MTGPGASRGAGQLVGGLPNRLRDRSGQRLDRLTVVRCLGVSGGRTYWLCRCDCGTDTEVDAGHLRAGHTRSCGCFIRDFASALTLRHGEARHGKATAEYRAWVGMKDRCVNRNNRAYFDYGGRGIGICERWLASFENFLTDMGRRPSASHSLDRIDNDRGYEPGNCRWATRKVQSNNRRQNTRYEIAGVTGTLKQLCEHFGQNYKVAHARRTLGWSLDRAVLQGAA